MHNKFHTYFNYWGLLEWDNTSNVYGFENISEENQHLCNANIPQTGACFGYVQQGRVFINLGTEIIQVNEGWWFSTCNGAKIFTSSSCRFVVFQRLGYKGIDACGKVESEGRLGYIDGCMNSVLTGPHKQGDPVLNSLYMPIAIHQTMHTHPSLRAGIIINGKGTCNTPSIVAQIDYSKEKDTNCNVHDLIPGAIFVLPADGWHKFRTDITDSNLSLVAYHPDSDFGPTDESAPMINRTMVGEEGNQHSAKYEKDILTQQ